MRKKISTFMFAIFLVLSLCGCKSFQNEGVEYKTKVIISLPNGEIVEGYSKGHLNISHSVTRVKLESGEVYEVHPENIVFIESEADVS